MTAVYTDPRCLDHESPGHPESPDRVRAALASLQAAPSIPELSWPEVRAADESAIEAVHDGHLVRRIAGLAASGGGWVDPDTFVCALSYQAALFAAGATLQAVGDTLAARQANAFVVVRPPGHHATSARSMGFCLFNNAAVAAHWATAEGGAGRVAILDLDVHHGNGTQEIFYRRPDVLYFSTHQFPFYPGSGRADETGADAGTGSTVNVPMAAGTGDEAFGVAMERVMAPIVRRFAPDLIIVSLGFDAHWADPLAQLRLSLAGYAAMLGTVRDLAEQLCGGRMVVLLEGGYNLAVVGAGSAMVARLLAGVPAAADPLGPAPLGAEPERSLQVIEAVRELHGL